MTTTDKKILSILVTNYISNDPEKFGLPQKLDLTSLVKGESAVLSQFVKKVQAMTDEQKEKIIQEDAKIAAWVKSHPDEDITSDRINEILDTPVHVPSQKIMSYFGPEVKTEVKVDAPKPVPPTPPPPLPTPPPTPTASAPRPIPQATPLPSTLPTEPPATPKTVVPDNELAQHVEEAFKSEIDDFYGKKGLLSRTNGINTPEWRFMAGLPAAKVVEYYQSDSSNSSLSPEIIKELTESNKHQQFLKQMSDLMQQTNGTVRPYASESIEQYFKRLGNYLMREHVGKQITDNK